VEKILQMS